MKTHLSIVVPIHNEEANILLLHSQLTHILSTHQIPFEIIFVDDGSKDKSWDIISKLAQEEKTTVKGYKLSRNFGKEAALAAGIRHATSPLTITMDCDLQHPPSLLVDMYRLINDQNYDIVDAVKEARQKETGINRLGAMIFYSLFKKMSGVDISNSTDMRMLNSRAKEAYLALSEATHFYRGMTTWIGFKRAQVFFVPAERNGGQSKWSFFRLLTLGIRALTSFSSAPLHLVTVLGLILAFLSLGLGGWSLYLYSQNKALPGFTTVILLQLIIGTLTMFGLGIMGAYVSRIYDEVKRRPLFLISDKTHMQTKENICL